MSSTPPINDYGGSGDTVHLAVANGFPPQSYTPIIDSLKSQFHVVNLPPRALWPDEKPPAKRQNWKHTLAQDLINGIQAHDLNNIIAVGHSFGGIATLLAAIAMPQRFQALILLDPTILPRVGMWWMGIAQMLNRDLGNPLAQGADRRRDNFESHTAAYERLRPKGLFRDWDEAAFQGYIDAMTPDSERGGVSLAWPRVWEAYYFRTLYAGTWGELPKLRGKMPILTVRGGTSDTLLPQAAARMRRILPEMAYKEVAGHGHLFPHTAPQQTTQIITEWLSTIN